MIDPKFVSEWNMKLQWGQKKKNIAKFIESTLPCLLRSISIGIKFLLEIFKKIHKNYIKH